VPVPPAGYVTSDDVERGKPHPDPYLAGAKKAGLDVARCMHDILRFWPRLTNGLDKVSLLKTRRPGLRLDGLQVQRHWESVRHTRVMP
jgi:hypothetical protein